MVCVQRTILEAVLVFEVSDDNCHRFDVASAIRAAAIVFNVADLHGANSFTDGGFLVTIHATVTILDAVDLKNLNSHRDGACPPSRHRGKPETTATQWGREKI